MPKVSLALGILRIIDGGGLMSSQPNYRPFSNLKFRSQGAALIVISIGCLSVIGWIFGSWVFAFANIFVFTVTIWWSATLLYRGEMLRQRAVEDLYEANATLEHRVEQKYRTIFENALEGIYQTTPDGQFLSVNPAAAHLLGYGSPKGLIQERTHIARQGCADPAKRDESKQLLEGNGSVSGFEYACRRKDGSLVWVSENARAVRDTDGKLVCREGNLADSTERKEAEQALRQSEARFSTIFRASPAAISINTVVGGRIIEVNDLYCQIYGYRREELIGRTVAELKLWANPEDRAPVMERLLREGSIRGLEAKSRLKSGEVRIMLASLELIELSGEKEPLLISMFTDITERKWAEDALRTSEAYSRNLISSSLDMIIAVGRDRRIIEFNPAAQQTFGYSLDEVLGQPVDLLYAAPSPGLSIHNATIEQGPRVQEILNKRKNGEVFPSLLASSPLRDARGDVVGVMGISRDITDKKQLESRILRNQRLESLGTLAGGIAHDLNNVLAPILMSLQMLQTKYTDPEDQQLLATLESSGNRGAEMVKQVLAFARGVQGERVLLQMAHLINELAKMLRQTVPKSIQIRTAVPKDLWQLNGDATQLHQVLMNLCVNARDAMPDGGTLTMEAVNFLVDQHYAGMNPEARVGPYVVVRITDTGTGMPAHIKGRIFEPFFTTKPLEKGSGLGLPTALGIVKSHGGFLEVDSELGRGTVFKVYLPAQHSGATDFAAAESSALPTGHGEMVLIVDDEASILDIAKQTLEMFGYQVLTATDGAEAISICAQHLGTIKVIITDMMMPIMEGPATIRAALKMDPELKIIGASGLSSNITVKSPEQMHMHAFLQKPFTAERLVRTVHDVLQKKPAPLC
jgi:two-component system cell cycle sensor histidine kinase/response regulator CckA